MITRTHNNGTATGKNQSPAIPRHPLHIYKPTHGESFPKKEKAEGPGRNTGVTVQPDEPTSTPDLLLKAQQQEGEFERSERIAAGENIVPADDKTEWIEREQDDWLDKDARS